MFSSFVSNGSYELHIAAIWSSYEPLQIPGSANFVLIPE